MSAVPDWLIYGAYGYTGQLIVQEAVDRGLNPIVAGRDQSRLQALAKRLGLRSRAFQVDEVGALKRGLDGVNLVLNCAGPFSATAASMIDGCLQLGAHYLDISGEIDVYAQAHQHDQRARARGLVLCPGAGFDVVPTDCLAALLKRELPEANQLVLAFEAEGGPSPGTARTTIEGLSRGSRVRRNGQLVPIPAMAKTREVEFAHGRRTTACIPWGDVYSAYVTTQIPEIEVYMALPPRLIARFQRFRPLLPLLGLAPVQWWLKRRAASQVSGPDEAARARTQCHIWGEVQSLDGRRACAQMLTPNGYELTAEASVRIAEKLLRGSGQDGGYYTPALLMGADFVRALDGVQLVLSGASD